MSVSHSNSQFTEKKCLQLHTFFSLPCTLLCRAEMFLLSYFCRCGIRIQKPLAVADIQSPRWRVSCERRKRAAEEERRGQALSCKWLWQWRKRRREERARSYPETSGQRAGHTEVGHHRFNVCHVSIWSALLVIIVPFLWLPRDGADTEAPPFKISLSKLPMVLLPVLSNHKGEVEKTQ